MIAMEAPPVVVPAVPEPVVVGRRESSQFVATSDLPLVLTKGGVQERALARRALYLRGAVTVTQAVDSGALSYRWTHQAFLQRQVCFTSFTGLFSCTQAEAEPLPETAEGEAPAIEAQAEFPLADAAAVALAEGLKARAAAIFDADRRTHLDPLLRAAGVAVVQPARR